MNKLIPIIVTFLFVGMQTLYAQINVKGKVLDDKNEEVPGANVQVKGTTMGTYTDVDGSFSIELPEGKNVLSISSIGYNSQEVTVQNNQTDLVIQLTISSKELEEAVVVGYGVQSKKTLIGGATTIKEDEFKNVPTASFTNTLQGKSPGIQITEENGKPGAVAYVRIRGVGSINSSSQPLFVIDGVPSTADAYNSLNPNDIMDVSVLKDASTTAIYGSRGSNGVIMVTTKKGSGKAGSKPIIAWGSQIGFKQKTEDKFDLMSFDEKLKFERDLGYTNGYLLGAVRQDGYNSISDVPDSEVGKYWDLLRPDKTNWFNVLLRPGYFQQHDFSVAASTEKTNVYFSLQLYDEDGISVGSYFNRISGNISVDHQFTDWFKLGQNFRVAKVKERVLRDRYNVQNPFVALYSYNAYEPVYDFTDPSGYNATVQGFNVIEGINGAPSGNENIYGLSNTYVELTPLKDFTLRSQLGVQYGNNNYFYFLKPGSILDMTVNPVPTGSKTDRNIQTLNYVWSNTLQYKKLIDNAHSFNALIGTEYTYESYNRVNLTSSGYPPSGTIQTQNISVIPTSTSTSLSEWSLFSLFGRAEYSYMGRYGLNVSLRNDGSSRFGSNNRYGTFWAVGGFWNLAEESFMYGQTTLTTLKLWATYGTSGNDQIGNYNHRDLYSYGSYNNQSSSYPNQVGNPDLTWEKNTNYSFGLDFGLLKERIAGNVTYYNRQTKDLLLRVPLSPTTGMRYQYQNVGDMTNSGVELMLNVELLRHKNYSWSVGGNITFNKNRIDKLISEEDIVSPNSVNGRLSIGKPIDVWYLKKYAGVDRETGSELWYKEDGTTTNDYNQADFFYLDNKSPDPTAFGGFNTMFSYKNVSLKVDFSYSLGHWTYNAIWRDLMTSNEVYSTKAKDLLDYWTPDNKDAANPKLVNGMASFSSDRWLQQADVLRLRNVTISYQLPESVVSKLKMQNISVYVQGRNLWYWAPFYKGDPEVGIGSSESNYTRPGNISLYSYPQTMGVTCGINFTF